MENTVEQVSCNTLKHLPGVIHDFADFSTQNILDFQKRKEKLSAFAFGSELEESIPEKLKVSWMTISTVLNDVG